MMGSPAGFDRDGTDFYFESVSRQNLLEANDIETTEAWYPIRFAYRRRGSALAPGKQRGSAGVELAYRATNSTGLTGTAIGGHTQIPSVGSAGGAAGQPTYIAIRHQDGTEDHLSLVDQGFELGPDDEFVCRAAGGAGWGDPLDRDPADVERDVASGLISTDDARAVYGVIRGDFEATTTERAAIAKARLAGAQAPSAPAAKPDVDLASLPAMPSPRGRTARPVRPQHSFRSGARRVARSVDGWLRRHRGAARGRAGSQELSRSRHGLACSPTEIVPQEIPSPSRCRPGVGPTTT